MPLSIVILISNKYGFAKGDRDLLRYTLTAVNRLTKYLNLSVDRILYNFTALRILYIFLMNE